MYTNEWMLDSECAQQGIKWKSQERSNTSKMLQHCIQSIMKKEPDDQVLRIGGLVSIKHFIQLILHDFK